MLAPAVRASLISTAVYSSVIMAPHYRAAALGSPWISFWLRSPRSTVREWPMIGPFPIAGTYLLAYARMFVIRHEHSWGTQTGTRARQILTQIQKHSSITCTFIGRLSVWCVAARNSCVSSPAPFHSQCQQRGRQSIPPPPPPLHPPPPA